MFKPGDRVRVKKPEGRDRTAFWDDPRLDEVSTVQFVNEAGQVNIAQGYRGEWQMLISPDRLMLDALKSSAEVAEERGSAILAESGVRDGLEIEAAFADLADRRASAREQLDQIRETAQQIQADARRLLAKMDARRPRRWRKVALAVASAGALAAGAFFAFGCSRPSRPAPFNLSRPCLKCLAERGESPCGACREGDDRCCCLWPEHKCTCPPPPGPGPTAR